MKIFSFLSIGQVIVKLCLIGYLGRFRFQTRGGQNLIQIGQSPAMSPISSILLVKNDNLEFPSLYVVVKQCCSQKGKLFRSLLL